MGLSFVFPWLLLGIFLLLFLPKTVFGLTRALTLAFLIIALAQPQIIKPSKSIFVLVDVSESVSNDALEVLKQFDFSKFPKSQIFIFAGDISSIQEVDPEELITSLQTYETDISKALQVAQANNAGRILLLSDGAASLGNTLAALPNIPVDTYFVPSRKNIRLELIAPEQVSKGEAVKAIAVIESDLETEATLQVNLNGEELPQKVLELSKGRTVVPFNFSANESNLALDVRLSTKAQQPLIDDSALANISVNQDDPLLVINDLAMTQLLGVQGFNVVQGTVSDVKGLLPYGAIILREGAGSFTIGQLELLRQYVKDGGGLMMTGGPTSFGFGNWYRTPIEEVLPVNTDLRSDVVVPLVAMIMVLDSSQSMSAGNPNKIELAKQGAIDVIELAYREDLLGLITFSDKEKWIFHLRKATERGKQEMKSATLNVSAEGGTVLAPAYRSAINELSASEAAIKHIIILSDGQLYDGSGPFGKDEGTDFAQIAQLAHEKGITTSTIAIGQRADFERLASIAKGGNGRYYSALEVSTLPRIFADEALSAKRSLLREGAFPLEAYPHPLMPRGAGSLPNVEAYIASELKSDSEVLISTGENEPILAISRQGLGRTAALTTDLSSWAGDLKSWEMLPGLLGTVIRWLKARPAEYNATVSEEGKQLKVVVDAIKNGEYINGEELVARYDALEVPLEQTAPGRYEGLLDKSAKGGPLLIISGTEIVSRREVSFLNSEFDAKEGMSLLKEIAERTGGEVLDNSFYSPKTLKQAISIWHWPALIAFILFFTELIWRRYYWTTST